MEKFIPYEKLSKKKQRELDALNGETAAIRRTTEEKLAALRAALSELDKQLALAAQLEFTERRCEELEAEARAVTAELEGIDAMLALSEDFVRYKAAFIEDTVNSRFTRTRFRLFNEQVNGGLADCCDVLVDGSAFGRSANTGAEVYAGLEIIGVLSRFCNVTVPVFIDNMESVEALPPVPAQIIRLEVDKHDRALRMEIEGDF